MRKSLPSFLRHPLAREIALALVIKLLIIVAIFYLFFDGRSLRPDADSVADHLTLGGPQGTR